LVETVTIFVVVTDCEIGLGLIIELIVKFLLGSVEVIIEVCFAVDTVIVPEFVKVVVSGVGCGCCAGSVVVVVVVV
jgi:hypothetical protein